MGDVGGQGPEGVVGAVLSPDFLKSSVGDCGARHDRGSALVGLEFIEAGLDFQRRRRVRPRRSAVVNPLARPGVDDGPVGCSGHPARRAGFSRDWLRRWSQEGVKKRTTAVTCSWQKTVSFIPPKRCIAGAGGRSRSIRLWKTGQPGVECRCASDRLRGCIRMRPTSRPRACGGGRRGSPPI